MATRQKPSRALIAAATTTMMVAAVGACVAPPPRSAERVAIIGDSMLASTSADKVAAWAWANYSSVWFAPHNGAGLLREPPGHPEDLVPMQLPPSGTFPRTFVVSSGWNDTVVGGFDPEDVIAAADALLDTLAAEGVERVAWLLNRDHEEYFVYLQKAYWTVVNPDLPPGADFVQTEETFNSAMADLAQFNQHLRQVAASPIGGTLHLRLIEWGQLADATAEVVTVPSGIWPAQPIYWSTMFDHGLPGPDQTFPSPNNDFDIVHPGDVGAPSGADIETAMIAEAVAGCP